MSSHYMRSVLSICLLNVFSPGNDDFPNSGRNAMDFVGSPSLEVLGVATVREADT